MHTKIRKVVLTSLGIELTMCGYYSYADITVNTLKSACYQWLADIKVLHSQL